VVNVRIVTVDGLGGRLRCGGESLILIKTLFVVCTYVHGAAILIEHDVCKRFETVARPTVPVKNYFT
jgi:hypothetical protein